MAGGITSRGRFAAFVAGGASWRQRLLWVHPESPAAGLPARAWWVATRLSLAVLLMWLAVVVWGLVATPAQGMDRVLYMSATDSWLAGHGLYRPEQLAGPYAIDRGFAVDPLYPPPILYLTVPFRFLPPVLWWAVPMAMTVWCVATLRPRPWTWPVLLGLMLFPTSWLEFFWGGPSMWILAFAAAGARYGWPSVMVLMKPTVALFALLGSQRRSWRIALVLLLLACIPFGGLWVDWVRAAIVDPTNGGILYSLGYVPVMCIPLVAWLGSSNRRMPHSKPPVSAAR
jgi:hypothetical protein